MSVQEPKQAAAADDKPEELKVSVVVPSFDEEETVGRVVSAISDDTKMVIVVDEGERLVSARPVRDRQIQQTMTGGALGGGALLVGFGLVPGLFGAAAGALIGYFFERSVGARSTSSRV